MATEAQKVSNCPRQGCGSPLVYPVDFNKRGNDRWAIKRICPECGWEGVGIFSEEDTAFCEDLQEDARQEMKHMLRWLARKSRRITVKDLC